jgi:hypothetical protein
VDAELTPRSEWNIERAEALLNSLKGVVSARIVARPGGVIDEIHLLTEGDVAAKQSVRNVESALLAHFGLKIDHRKVSVAQKDDGQATELAPFEGFGGKRGEGRFLFVTHRVNAEKAHQVRITVTVEWGGEQYEGEAIGADLPRARLEATALATLRAIERTIVALLGEGEVALSVDGVKQVEAFDGQFVLVAIHAIHGRSITALAGAAAVEDTVDRAVIMGTLQAADRWVRGRI